MTLDQVSDKVKGGERVMGRRRERCETPDSGDVRCLTLWDPSITSVIQTKRREEQRERGPRGEGRCQIHGDLAR